jgi:predicted ArsR family transcriptional regulator
VESSRWRERLLESTRGRLLALLQAKNRTVNQLADELQITDNAVRAHLVSLERDGLVRRVGTKAGVRRPHVSYGLSHGAEHIFPKPYGPLLATFVAIVRKRLGPRALRTSLRQLGRGIARDYSARVKGRNRAQRIDAALALLKEMGGAAEVSRDNGKVVIRGNGCPLAAVTAHYRDACLIAESLLAEVIGAPVKECCRHGPNPSCRFEIG